MHLYRISFPTIRLLIHATAVLYKSELNLETIASTVWHAWHSTLKLGAVKLTWRGCNPNLPNLQVAMMISPIVFPLAFSINESYRRREKVLDDYSAFFGAAAELYWLHR